MKDNLINKSVLIFSLIAVFFCSFYYPILRDQFYYLDGYINPFTEYFESYLAINPRIGQLFSNLIGRNFFLQPFFAVLLFVSFFYVLFLVVFRYRFSIKKGEHYAKMIFVIVTFIFLINYFGEMFFYIPYSTNYTLTHIFYLLYLYLIIEFFVDQKDKLTENKISYLSLVIFGFLLGMGNEHVVPVIIGVFTLLSIILFIKRKQHPSRKLIIFTGAIVIGYLFLFFAPANSLRFNHIGEDAYEFKLQNYFKNLLSALKLYYYYNVELLVAIFLLLIGLVIGRKKITTKEFYRIALLIFVGIIALFLGAYSPLLGTRLFFFSNICFISAILIFITAIFTFWEKQTFNLFANCILIVFFLMAGVVCFQGHKNYKEVMSDIETQKQINSNVHLKKGFNYNVINPYFDRKIILETGESYIDKYPQTATSVEKNIISYYKLREISVAK